MRFVLFLTAILLVISTPHSPAAEAKRLTVVDYFLQLPDGTFESPAKNWLHFMKQPTFGHVDLANGYLDCTGDGAQAAFEVALFRYTDGRPLLAVCMGELEGKEAKFLSFYEPGASGKMHEVKRSIFPIANEKGYLFDLPHKGRTIIVRTEKGNKVKAKYAWNGEKFVEEK